ncbi:MAG TPA: histidine kinase [Algoriphagus sp.]|jgi:signal transduction histidine kinase|uniref:sensor histidine kinase n=1 Tax=unclassified Algoriphagus TaxID=2641541 RepID=UPI000C499543|nr:MULTISPECIES: ATP-binding protein [unclassified Algoriphagus]MAL15879.1 histidine kinase [Algoriphagus sp.]QYH37329.1 histidine kinase [Algoriphagus sp. NBT04N3]HAH36411.1 histidine kinase [Algoriphagus sp.]HAS60229.1 histidine kinase [Algoriphagus sp.]HCB45148.1 histidine kinase [Algoriphagus sp.]|tara:strand:- start:1957 stop:3192 length:1236 start_codon:yes stop_codon:yes gene_type:complete
MKNRFQDLTSIDFYQNRKQVKWLVVIVSLIIGAGSIWYTNRLVEELRERERRQIELLSSALEYAASNTDNLTFINQEIIQQNYSIPVIMVDASGEPIEFRNIRFKKNADGEDSLKTLDIELEKMKAEYEPILLREADILVYYRNSELLINLKYYPYVQLAVILIFGMLAYAIFNQSKIAEQNRVWAGLTKETAHQLGTPIASLMAWIDYLRNSPVWEENKEIITEMDKDVVKLRMVTERFSSIGSKPMIQAENLYQVIEETITYLRPRISTKVDLNIKADSRDLDAMMNKPLFEWVIENICKNAVDAMKGKGTITIELLQDSDKFVIIDITDNGKGMEKRLFRKVFNPGFSTRQRGWGLGLTLAKRIIESYHGGKIFVKSSEVGVGTTFRIVLHSTLEGAEQFVTEGILEY